MRACDTCGKHHPEVALIEATSKGAGNETVTARFRPFDFYDVSDPQQALDTFLCIRKQRANRLRDEAGALMRRLDGDADRLAVVSEFCDLCGTYVTPHLGKCLRNHPMRRPYP